MSKPKSIPASRPKPRNGSWGTHDSSDYIDWSTAERARLSNLKPSTRSISICLPPGLREPIKIPANKRDVPYQSLIKM
jgi:predicted DNA binding CopG/RHH family protein